MNISELLLDRKLLTIKIGEKTNNIPNLELICDQQGNIPTLFGYRVDKLYFEITVIENIIIGIQFDFSYDIGKISFEINENKIPLDGETELTDLLSFLKNTNLDFDTIESKIEPKRIALTKSNSNFYFSNGDRLLKINNFDWKLYERLTNSN